MGLRSVKIKRIQRVVKYSLIALIVAALAITAALVPYRLLLPAVAIPERAEGEMRVHFLDVGQGDCTIVEFPSGDALVVDAGDGSFANDGYLIRYLKGIAPASLTLVAPHADADHFGGFTEILRAFDVEKVYLPPVGADTSAYRQFLDAVRREGCAQDTLARYKSLLDDSGAYAVCISPHAAEETDENESAAVFYLEYEGVRVVFSSDISAALIIADKTDVRRNRVRQKEMATFDIHDRVNYAVTEAKLKVNAEKRVITLNLQLDESICSMLEYFEIFLQRMLMCRRASEILGSKFKMTANGSKIV